jgi:HTH-type transcriptional regulator/antitoxin MqsA
MTTTRKRDKKKTFKTCPECGGKMRWETREDSVVYKGHRKVFSTTAWWCESCQEAIIDGPALQVAERAFVELRAEVEQVLLPEEVSEVRRKLNISQREAGRILGGGPRAFQKYESGQVPVSEPMKNLLVLLRNDPKRLKELRATGDGARSRTTRRERESRPAGSTRASRS